MSKYLVKNHRCVTPEVAPDLGLLSVWQCDCGLKYLLTTDWQNQQQYCWTEIQPWRWNEEEGRLKNANELAEYWASRQVPLSRWQRIVRKVRRW